MTDEKATNTFKDMLYQHARALNNLSVYYAAENSQVTKILIELNQILKNGQKLVFVGCGKSFKIVSKSVAMLTSLGLDAACLHPVEAMHGDIGVVREGDAILLCSSSGETQELIHFTQYLNTITQTSKKILVTSKPACTLQDLVDCVLFVPQPLEFQETTLQQGLQSPTVSTTLMLTALDCLCLALSEIYYDGNLEKRRQFFKKMHPGGGIGKKPLLQQSVPSLLEHASTSTSPVAVAELHLAAQEHEFLRSAVQNDWCIINGTCYSSNLLQHRYREWTSTGNTQFSLKTLLNLT